ncbi:MAG TPA: LamG domain-containing protein, partial [Polyangiaceae bacterium]
NDPKKTAPGVCGCGVADTDTDTDGTPDCIDKCPADPQKTAPGVCGCGVAEAPCLALKSSLLHRYSFTGSGTTVTDSKGSANGTVMGKGAALSGTGTLVLTGGVLPVASDPGQYVELPTNCLMGLSNATFEAWVTWSGGTDSTTYRSYWQRVFDFGETSTTTSGTYLMLTPRAASATGTSRVAFTASMGAMSEAPIVNGALLSAGALHFTVVVDQANSLISLYTNGVLSAGGALSSSLSAINASNCWLGRSQYAGDPYFAGTFDEFRVYSAALSAADVAFSQSAGPNPAFL